MLMVMKIHKCTKNHRITHIIIVYYIAYKLYLNKIKFHPTSENKMMLHGNFIVDN